MSAFDRLHPALQHHIVNSLGWRELRPFQEACIAPALDGEHLLVLAPTAGGKTEAAFFPLLSRMLSEEWGGLAVLYVCPLRALLNNLEARLDGYARLVGRRVGLWHGDVGEGERRRLLADPPDALLTTPESLEVMLVSRRTDKARLFGSLRAVVVDEVHAFAGDDRGWHLLSVLERASRFAGRELQRLGLSATVGNPEDLLGWLAGSCTGPRRVVGAGAAKAPSAADVEVDYVGSLGNAALVISRLHGGQKRLVFCDSRARVERLAAHLRDRGVETHVSHSSLSADQRRAAEAAFAHGNNCVIVATSTLELGIDVGDLDRVIQIDAPTTVSSFLQRLGRTGRRRAAERNCLFLATSPTSLLRAAGLLELWGTGYVEPVAPPATPYHILAQQVMALALQQGGVGAADWWTWLDRMPGFAALPAPDRDTVLQHMLATGILAADQGILWLGRKGEEAYGRRNFMALLSAFTTAPLFTVRHGTADVGHVDQISFLVRREGPVVLLLGGRGWLVNHVDWPRRIAYVEPTQAPGRSLWMGEGQPLAHELCQAIRRVLCGAASPARLSKRAVSALEDVRDESRWVHPERTSLVTTDGTLRWWTFGGLLANAALEAHLRPALGQTGRVDNLSIAWQPEGDGAALERQVRALRGTDPAKLAPPVADQAIDDLKFSECLPRELATRMLQDRLRDLRGMEGVLREPVESVVVPGGSA